MGQTGKSKTSGQVSRRDFLASVAASSLLPRVAASPHNIPAIAPNRQSAWIEEWPLVIVGNWDDAPIFRRRHGGTWTWQEDDYHREHTEETVRKLKELGVTMAIIHFYKGFGLAAERQHIQRRQEIGRPLPSVRNQGGRVRGKHDLLRSVFAGKPPGGRLVCP